MIQRAAKEFWVAVGVGVVILLAGHFIPHLALHLRQMEFDCVDWRFHVRGPQTPDPRIAIVTIDDASLRAIGRWPWPGRRLGDLINAIESAKPIAVGMDILQAEKSNAVDDTALADAMRAGGNVYLPCFVSRTEAPAWFFEEPAMRQWKDAAVAGGEERGSIDRVWAIEGLDVPLKQLADAAAGMGAVALEGSTDGVYREAPPVMELGGKLVPSQPLALALRAMEAEPRSVSVVAGRSVAYGERTVSVNSAGLMMINFAGPSGTYPHVPAADVLARKPEALEALRGKVVLVGATAPGLLDLRPSPYDPAAPGVEGLANVTANLMNGGELKPLSEPAEMVLSLEVIVSVAAVVSLLPGVWGTLAAVALMVVYWLAGVAGFDRQEVVTPLLLPTLVAVGTGFAALAMKLRKAEVAHSRAMDVFRRFVPPQVAERLAEADLTAAMRGVRREVTVLFMDMAGSTVYTRELDPEDFVEALNRFFEEAHTVVWRWEGTLDKFIGDGLLAFFNAPARQEDHALRAVRTGLDLLAMIEREQELWEYYGLKDLGIRVGIATGEVVVGYVGSEDRQQYTVVGPTVNLASRLMDLAKTVGVKLLVSDTTYAELGGAVEARYVGRHSLAGFDVEQRAYEVTAVKANPEGKE